MMRHDFLLLLCIQSELNGGPGNKKKPEDRKEYKDMKEKAHATSLKLATAAKEAETNIKYVLNTMRNCTEGLRY